MSDQPKNLEVIEQGGSHNLDITFLNRPVSLGGVPVAPDGYDSGDPGASVSAEILVYDNNASDPDDPANWSTPAAGLNAPTIGTLVDGGSTGNVEAPVTVQGGTKLSSLLESEDDLKWGIHWDTTINGVAVEFFEFFTVVSVGGASFGDGLLCTADDVRAHSGFTDTRDITDTQLEGLIHRAQREFLQEVAVRRRLVLLSAAPEDTTDKEFIVPSGTGYGWLFPDGFGELEDATELAAFYLDTADALTSVGIVTRDEVRNRVTLATAKADTDTAHLSGWLCHVRDPDPDLAKDAVCTLTTHLVDIRSQQPGSIHLSDPTGGRNLGGRDWTHRHEYKKLVKRFLRDDDGQVGAGQTNTRIGRRRSIL